MTDPCGQRPSPGDLTRILDRLEDGDESALSAAVAAAYEELKIIAHLQLRRLPRDGTMNTTVVVHEAYLKLAGSNRAARFADRGHFFAVASMAMRQILVDYVRSQQAEKRGGGRRPVDLSQAGLSVEQEPPSHELLLVDEALTRLEVLSPRLARVVECRFFGGLTEAETGKALGVSERTVRRDWVKARAWLARELGTE